MLNFARPIASRHLLLLVAAWIALVPNAVTLQRFFASPSAGSGLGHAMFVLGGWIFMVAVVYVLCVVPALLARGTFARVVGAAWLIAAAATSYFTTFYGTLIDKGMFRNIVETDVREASDLLTVRFALWVLLVGVAPAVLAMRLPLRAGDPRIRGAVRALGIVLALLALSAATVWPQYSKYASAARNRDIVFETVAPANLLAAATRYGADEFRSRTVRAPRGEDAHAAYAIKQPRLLVLVLGETARAKNHGLNGYLRDTTPGMRAAGGYYFADTESCGTATTISVPCIFSGFSRTEFSLLRGLQSETLIDVVLRSGARVVWLDNDSGCKDVCRKAEFLDFTGSANPKFCPEPGECHDEILLEGLEGRIRSDGRDTLVVLHLKGSHGPAYYKRYPRAFERFTPTCLSSDLTACDIASIVNAYDNTILYTDHVVARTIDLVKDLGNQFAGAVLYVSDHGESLGEHGLFLHGMPYAIAPLEQTRVPMYAWVSPNFMRLERWDAACMARQTRMQRSHDNVYATVLGFMEVESVEYKPALDIFEACDPPGGAPASGDQKR